MERKLYRILDANFNRGREALRTMEEFCRFVLDEKMLAGRAKQMRHSLCEEIGKLDAEKLLSERDSRMDVGRGLMIADPQERSSLLDCFRAAAKRATEALRVLGEAARIDKPDIAAGLERIRFETYTLEKDIMQILPRCRFHGVRLYVLIPAGPEIPDAKVLALAGACIAGGADALQLRAKGISDDRFYDLAVRFVSLCRTGGCVSILNDRADLAALAGADGVHLGQHDLPAAQARKLFFKPALIGGSTHTMEELRSAVTAGADYAGIGSCFPTPTKPDLAVAGPEYVRKALEFLKDTAVGHVAIGGITAENVQSLIDLGVRAAAVSSAVCSAPDPGGICRKFKDIFAKNGL